MAVFSDQPRRSATVLATRTSGESSAPWQTTVLGTMPRSAITAAISRLSLPPLSRSSKPGSERSGSTASCNAARYKLRCLRMDRFSRAAKGGVGCSCTVQTPACTRQVLSTGSSVVPW
jgi:hypothetical protein